MLDFKKVKYENDISINGRIFIRGKKNRIEIGKNCAFMSSSIINSISGFNHCYLWAENDGYIHIGDNVGISNANIASYIGITIEDNVLIGSGTKIWDSDFHSLNYDSRMNGGDKNIKSNNIRIKNGAFIGACCIILKGVTIGQHSIIGAGSVVTKNVPDNEIWAGNPARFIKKLRDEHTN